MLPRLTWTDAATISVAAWPGSPASVSVELQDGKSRSFTGAIAFTPASTGEGGLDTGSEGASRWYYLYLVPKAADDDALVVRGSMSAPATGPTDYTNFSYIGAVYNDAGSNIRRFVHTDGSRFMWLSRDIHVSGAAWDASPQRTDIVVPATSSAAYLWLFIQVNASGTGSIRAWPDFGSSPTDSDAGATLVAACYDGNSGYPAGYVWGAVPMLAASSIYYRRVQGGASAVFDSGVAVAGWIDAGVSR
jgi:hypothetical protein